MNQIKDMVKTAYEALDEKKGNDIVILDIAEISTLADYFVICDGGCRRKNACSRISSGETRRTQKQHLGPYGL